MTEERIGISAVASFSDEQMQKFAELERLLTEENQRKNLVSQKSLLNFKERHLAHSLALASKPFPNGATVVDWGTGGGFPLLPLAIVFPETNFVGIDSVGRKVEAVERMAARLDLQNVAVQHARAEATNLSAEYSVSRAVARLAVLWGWHKRLDATQAGQGVDSSCWRPGLICLKGGDLDGEVAEARTEFPAIQINVTPLARVDASAFANETFVGKSVVEVWQ